MVLNRKSLTFNRKLKKSTRKRIFSEKMGIQTLYHLLFNRINKDKMNMIRVH